jgi:hypothetical protein
VEEKDAKHTIIHVRQMHTDDDSFAIARQAYTKIAETRKLYDALKATLSEQEFKKNEPLLQRILAQYEGIITTNLQGLQKINEIQKEIHQVASNLLDSGLVRKIYSEGVVEKSDENPYLLDKVGVEAYLKNFRDIVMATHPGLTIEDYSSKFRYTPGGAIRLVYEKSAPIYLCDATMEELGLKSIAPQEKSSSSLNERRENITLSHLLSDVKDEPYSVLVYGTAHDFSNNVRDWNNKNPSRKVNLRVYTPKNLQK